MSQLIVADKYRVPELDGTRDPKNKILVRKGMKVLPNYVADQNAQENGILFIIDEAATKALREVQEGKKESRSIRSIGAKLTKAELVDVLITGKMNEGKKSEPQNIQDIPDDQLGLKALRAKYPQFDIKARSADEFRFELGKLLNQGENGGRMTSPPEED